MLSECTLPGNKACGYLSTDQNLVGSPRNKHKARPTAAGPFEFINNVIKGLNVPTFKIV